MNNISIELDRILEIRSLLKGRKNMIVECSEVIDKSLTQFGREMDVIALSTSIQEFKLSVTSNNTKLYECIDRLLAFLNSQITEYMTSINTTEQEISNIASKIDSLN